MHYHRWRRTGDPLGLRPRGTHGQSYTATYDAWAGLRQRCLNPENLDYKDYGGRGITVCTRWDSFENFLADMGEKPLGKTIGRIDNDKGYEPENCHWESWSQQSRNRRFGWKNLGLAASWAERRARYGPSGRSDKHAVPA